MESAIRNVVDLSADERQLYESVLGHPLRDDQRIIVQLDDVDTGRAAATSTKRDTELPDWCAIWADLSDEEIAELAHYLATRKKGSEQP